MNQLSVGSGRKQGAREQCRAPHAPSGAQAGALPHGSRGLHEGRLGQFYPLPRGQGLCEDPLSSQAPGWPPCASRAGGQGRCRWGLVPLGWGAVDLQATSPPEGREGLRRAVRKISAELGGRPGSAC